VLEILPGRIEVESGADVECSGPRPRLEGYHAGSRECAVLSSRSRLLNLTGLNRNIRVSTPMEHSYTESGLFQASR
jgi:hypothetical protein